MTLVFAAIAPHGGPVFDRPEAPTRQAMDELGVRFRATDPDAVIVLTPHGVHVDGQFAVVRSVRLQGNASEWTDADTHYEGPGDPELADACVRGLDDDGLPVTGVTFGATAAILVVLPAVPLEHIPKPIAPVLAPLAAMFAASAATEAISS